MEFKAKREEAVSIRISAMENGQEIGRIFLYLIKNDLHKRSYCLIEDLFINKDYQKRGIGSELLIKAIEEAKKQGCYKIVGNSRDSREKVHSFYLKNGFKKYGFEFRIDL